MAEWWSADPPRVARWRYDERLQIRDDGQLIRAEWDSPVRLELLVARKSGPHPWYSATELWGSLYEDESGKGLGYGRLLTNTMVVYLQALAEPEYEVIKGTLRHDPAADPPSHRNVREDFFAAHSGRQEGVEWEARVADLKVKPSHVPGQRERGLVVPAMIEFRKV